MSNALATAREHHQAGRLQEAERIYLHLLELDPMHAEAWHLLGLVAYQTGRHHTAADYIERSIALSPDSPAPHNNLGLCYLALGRREEAVACFRTALAMSPRFVQAHYNLGNAQQQLGRPAEAIACYRRALHEDPTYVSAHINLGNALKSTGELAQAIACYRQALRLKPDARDAWVNLGSALQDQGNLQEAEDCFRRALAADSKCAVAHSNLLLLSQFRVGVSLAQLARDHAKFESQQAAHLTASSQPPSRLADPARKLRLGFLSPDLARHPVGFFLIGVAEQLDRHACDVVCYSDRLAEDELTERFRVASDQWRTVRDWSDERLAQQIEADQVDILFDLCGHTANNRLLVFARRPAPIQITWMGYVGTTGLATMDYLLADRHEIPPNAERHYRERVLRMPDGYVCYEPPQYAPPVGPPPALRRGSVTFGGFHMPAKIGPQVVRLWAAILRSVPGSRLLTKYRGWDDPAASARIVRQFAAEGIDASRLEIEGFSVHAETLARYRDVDIALDPFPYSGGLTTCEALWMGVPVITLVGETFAGRHAFSHLNSIRFTETIARDPQAYVRLAVSLAGDLPRLASLRAGLRERMAHSPLCDTARFAASLLTLLRDVWRQCCADAFPRR